MITRKSFFLSVIVAFSVGCGAGVAIGGYAGLRAGMASILNSALVKDAREVGARIVILRDLRAGARKQAIDKLETGLDDILIGFDPAEPYSGLEVQTIAALRKAIDEAKAYRAAHPWALKQKDLRADMVRNLFARDPYGPAGEALRK